MRKPPTKRFYPVWLSTIEQTPGVGDTLRWLVARGRTGLPLLVTRPSRLNDLVRLEHGRWHADSAAFERVLARSIASLPREPDRLAALLCGFGEMAARSHFDPMPIVEAKLRQHRLSERDLIELAAAAVALAWKDKRPPPVPQIAITQAFAKPVLDWDLLEFARSWGHDEPSMSQGGSYGLVFAMRIVLRLSPSALRRWHQRNSGKLVTSVLMSVIGAELRDDRDTLSDRLLATRIPCCTAFAIAIGAEPVAPEAAPVNYFALVAKLTTSGTSTADAIWQTAHVLKDAVHRHYAIASQGKALVFEARRDRKQSTRAGAPDQSNWIAARRADHAQRQSDHDLRLEALLNDLAGIWPADGLNETQMDVLDPAFVDTPQIRLRLAEKLAHTTNRQSLLKRNIDQFKAEVGLFADPTSAFDDYHAPEPERFYDLALVTARSFIALNRDSPEAIGHKTSNFLAKGVAAALTMLEQPFVATRQPMRWQSALSRTACALIFALLVAGSVEPAFRQAVEKLRQLALMHAANVLGVGQPSSRQRSVLDTLSGLAIQAMMAGPAERDELIAWSQRRDLPAMTRARALFAIAGWQPADTRRARDLFCEAAELLLSARADPEHLNRLAGLVDFAAARAWQANDAARLTLLVELWSTIKPAWGRYLSDCEDFAEVIARGLRHDGPERRRILEDDMFRGSYVRAVIVGTNGTA
ncbi:MAG: hypothetical protein R3D68_07230 [Hyphomicrobiaceae bacterium]